jgi:hypothetical protein
LCAFHRFVLDVTVERTVKSAERVLSVAVHPDGASQGGLPALPRFTGMHAQDCAPTAADGISPRPPFPWLSPKNVWFFTAANKSALREYRERQPRRPPSKTIAIHESTDGPAILRRVFSEPIEPDENDLGPEACEVLEQMVS